MTSPDLRDPEIRNLLDRNHQPVEALTLDPERLVQVKITCTQCHEPYPCPTRLALREESKRRLRIKIKEQWAKYPRRDCRRSEPHSEHSYTEWAKTYYCSGVERSSLECGRREPHDQHLWTQQPHLWPRLCPGTAYEIIDCDDVLTDQPHQAHTWRFRGADFWCPGG